MGLSETTGVTVAEFRGRLFGAAGVSLGDDRLRVLHHHVEPQRLADLLRVGSGLGNADPATPGLVEHPVVYEQLRVDHHDVPFHSALGMGRQDGPGVIRDVASWTAQRTPIPIKYKGPKRHSSLTTPAPRVAQRANTRSSAPCK